MLYFKKNPKMLKLLLVLCAFVLNIYLIDGHGYLKSPLSRNYAGKADWSNKHKPENVPPPDEFTSGLNCGGFSKQWSSPNNGRCGVCGDEWSAPEKPHEYPGIFAKDGFIAQCLSTSAQTIQAVVAITANHRGWFEFRLCPNNDTKTTLTQECFNEYLLTGTDESGQSGERFYISTDTGDFKFTLTLPSNLECSDCVLQWKYHAGNSWDCDPDDTCGLGKGNQEEFWNCADIAILPNCSALGSAVGEPAAQQPPAQQNPSTSGEQPSWKNLPAQNPPAEQNPATPVSSGAGQPNSGNPPPVVNPIQPVPGQKVCTALSGQVTQNWCNNNCNHVPPNCPDSLCQCNEEPEQMTEEMKEMGEEMEALEKENENLKKELEELEMEVQQYAQQEHQGLDSHPKGEFSEEIKVRTCTKKQGINGYRIFCDKRCPNKPDNHLLCSEKCDCSDTVSVIKYRCQSPTTGSLLDSLHDRFSDDNDEFNYIADLLVDLDLCGLYCKTAGIDVCTESALKCHCERVTPEL